MKFVSVASPPLRTLFNFATKLRLPDGLLVVLEWVVDALLEDLDRELAFEFRLLGSSLGIW